MSEDRGAELTARLQKAERQRVWPNQSPRDAATLIIVDRSASVPKLLMGRRHEGHKFMPGKFVFPGGRIEPKDRFAPSLSELAPEAAAALSRRVIKRSTGRERALALTAIRETFEETGLLLGRRAAASDKAAAAGEAWQPFLSQGVIPDLAPITFIGRAITPPRRPKRFDTRFFSVDREVICGEVPGVIGPDAELTELVWVDLTEARKLDLPAITSIMLDELEGRIEQGFGPGLPVPFYREIRGRFVRELL